MEMEPAAADTRSHASAYSRTAWRSYEPVAPVGVSVESCLGVGVAGLVESGGAVGVFVESCPGAGGSVESAEPSPQLMSRTAKRTKRSTGMRCVGFAWWAGVGIMGSPLGEVWV